MSARSLNRFGLFMIAGCSLVSAVWSASPDHPPVFHLDPLVPDLACFTIPPTVTEMNLANWITSDSTPVLIVFADRNLLGHHAQLAPFERLIAAHSHLPVRFALVLIHRRPESYAQFAGPVYSGQARIFVADLYLVRQILNPGHHAIVMAAHADRRIFRRLDTYCRYDTLKQTLDDLLAAQPIPGGIQK